MGAASRPRISALTLLLLAACTTTHLDAQPPPGFDLNGTWHLVPGESDPPPSRRELRAQGGMLAFITQDFPALRATEMRIEQNADSMGVRYDTGDYRDISWGNRQRGLWEVDAGWHDGQLVILSDAEDADARETLMLSDHGRRLVVETRVDSGGDHVDVTRVFRR